MSDMAAPPARWIDGKRWLWLLGPVVPLLVVSALWRFYSHHDTLALPALDLRLSDHSGAGPPVRHGQEQCAGKRGLLA